MQSTSFEGPFPNRSKEQAIPAEQMPQSRNEPKEANTDRDAMSEQPWVPRLDRRQSWSHQDHKHQLQERLLDVEQGRETGFSETRQGN